MQKLSLCNLSELKVFEAVMQKLSLCKVRSVQQLKQMFSLHFRGNMCASLPGHTKHRLLAATRHI